MSFGRDVRRPDLTMTQAPVAGGLEPRLFPPTRARSGPRWPPGRPTTCPSGPIAALRDAGVALVRAHGTLAEAVAKRLNRLPRRLALTQLEVAGVRARPGTSAAALLGVVIADRAPAAVDVAAGTVLVTPAGVSGPALETEHGCTALPGKVAAVAVRADGLFVLDRVDDLGALAPFGVRRRPPAELWCGIATTVTPGGLLCLAVRLAARPGRLTAARSTSISADPPPPCAGRR